MANIIVVVDKNRDSILYSGCGGVADHYIWPNTIPVMRANEKAPCFPETHRNFFRAQTRKRKSADFRVEYTSVVILEAGMLVAI
jgi:hypothetical protein